MQGWDEEIQRHDRLAYAISKYPHPQESKNECYLGKPEKLEIRPNDILVCGFEMEIGERVIAIYRFLLCSSPLCIRAVHQLQRSYKGHIDGGS